jgi:SAM-dependent methyltransferase
MIDWVDCDYTFWTRSFMADRWLIPRVGSGIEIGGSAHNSFGIPCANVDFTKEETIWKEEEMRICGHARQVDVVAFADALPFEDSSRSFVLNSHVFEHQPNPIKCLLEWARVVVPDGLIYSIIPHRDAVQADARLPLSSLTHQVRDYELEEDTSTHPVAEGHGQYGHYHRYTLSSYLYLVLLINQTFGLARGISLQIVDRAATDDKVSNGFVVVHKVIKR